MQKSAAFTLGAAGGYKENILIPDSVIIKIAKKTGVPPAQVKKAYIKKVAVNWGALLVGGGLGMGG